MESQLRELMDAVVGDPPRHDNNGPSDLTVLRVTVATGWRQVLYQTRRPSGYPYSWSSADPSGRYVLIDVGPGTTAVNGWIDDGRLVRLKPAGDQVIYETW